jgi:hypothetical protein
VVHGLVEGILPGYRDPVLGGARICDGRRRLARRFVALGGAGAGASLAGRLAINSLAHLFGKRRYPTTDQSRNSMLLALITTGEGWHNNHHYYQSSANQGFRWWEVDLTYYVLRMLDAVGLIWDLRRPPREVVDPRTALGSGNGTTETESFGAEA